MSDKEKAKAYDKAFNLAEQIHMFSSDPAEIKRMEELFPILKESYGERIRKDIVFYIAAHHKDDGEKARWLYWLEKQGEHNAICRNNDTTIDDELNNYCCKIYNALHKENGGKLSFARLQNMAMDIYQWCNEQKQGEQNPAWSEEDEKMLKECSIAVSAAETHDIDERKEMEIWLKSIKSRVQTKQEWSEEDDDDAWLNDIISKAEYNLQLNKGEINWLLSLKERYTWKPSEEQVEALQTAIGIVGELTPTASLLKEIREQLKKLKE